MIDIILLSMILHRPPDMVQYVANHVINCDILFVIAVVENESSFNPNAYNINKNGSHDSKLFQINSYYHPAFDNMDEHCRYASEFLSKCLRLEKGDLRRGLSRWNSGKPDNADGLIFADKVLLTYWLIGGNIEIRKGNENYGKKAK